MVAWITIKRLNGMDAMLLSSETPNLHTHTLKIAVIETSGYHDDEGPTVAVTPALRTAATIRRYRSGRIGAMSRARHRVARSPS